MDHTDLTVSNFMEHSFFPNFIRTLRKQNWASLSGAALFAYVP